MKKMTVSAACCVTAFPISRWKKSHIDRRIAQMQAEGVRFRPNSHIGKDIPGTKNTHRIPCVVLAIGSEKPRDLEARRTQ